MLFVFKGTNQVDPALYEKLTSSLKRMHSLKRFALSSRSLEYPLMRSLLLGTLCNTSTTEVYINNRSVGKYQSNINIYINIYVVGKCTHKVFNEDGLVNIIYHFCYKPLFRGVHYSYHGNSGYIN